MLIVFAVMAGSALVLGDTNCTSTCTAYKVCTSLNTTNNHTAFLKNSLLCDSALDTTLGKLYSNLSSCALRDAAIEVADLFEIGWDGVSSLEAIIGDQEFWLEGCKWEQIAAAACIYYSVPAKGVCTNTNVTVPTVTREGLFCPGECMSLANSCLNLKKYRHLTDSVTDFCNGVTTSNNATTSCFKAQVDQKGLSAPSCSDNSVKAKSLTGPYILAGIALALAVVALIGLALITCKNGSGVGAPNSF